MKSCPSTLPAHWKLLGGCLDQSVKVPLLWTEVWEALVVEVKREAEQVVRAQAGRRIDDLWPHSGILLAIPGLVDRPLGAGWAIAARATPSPISATKA
jgi:hypothetical protein